MNRNTDTPTGTSSGFLRRLARDESGNALVLITAAVFPLLGAIGGGIDMTRGYMAEARLAQTCDAAALAGRKVMSGETTPVMGGNDDGSREIDNFVDFNFQDGTFGSETVAWTADVDNTSGELSLTMSTEIPTSVMQIVGVNTLPISLSCSSIRSGTNVDVVLVLDTTGSMAWDLDSSSGNDNERLIELQEAAKRFVSVMMELRDQLAPAGLRVRVGIVPYSQTVNIGHHLMDENENYIEKDNVHHYSLERRPRKCDSGNNYCNTWDSYYNQRWYYHSYYYGKQTLDLSKYVSRGRDGSIGPYDWKGCVEMRPTITSIDTDSSFFSVPDGAWDIIDQAPGGSAPKWQPYLVPPNRYSSFGRYGWPTSGAAEADPAFSKFTNDRDVDLANKLVHLTDWLEKGPKAQYATATSMDPNDAGPNAGCPSQAMLIDEHSQSELDTAIEALIPAGGTYHNVGMYWGITLLSNQAPFVNTDVWPPSGGSTPSRPVAKYLIFMTDGTMDTSGHSYSAYGVEYASDYGNHVRADTGSSTGTRHRARFRILCESAKQQGIQVHTVAFTAGVGTDDLNSLKKCASSTDDFYQADSGEEGELEDVFEKIGRNIGYLRVSQ